MIFKFDSTLKTDDDIQKLLLARCLVLMNEKGHRIDRNGFFICFVEEEVMKEQYLGKMEIALIKSNHELFEVNRSLRTDYRNVIIGYGDGMYAPDDVQVILKEPSLVAVENERNDGSVIERWAECYVEDERLHNVNETVYEALKDGRLRWLNGGGGDGTIRNRIEDQLKVYGKFPQLKITTVFDSDKSSAEDEGNHNRSLKEFLDANGYEYHCLVKREMENYFPLEVYKECGLVVEGHEIPQYSEEAWDYLDIKEDKDKRPGDQAFLTYNKNLLPKLASMANKKHLKQRIQHQPTYPCHYGEVDEIQHVLLMLAKFV